MDSREQATLQECIDQWNEADQEMKNVFLDFKHHLETKSDTRLSFVARPGVSYSLRAANPAHDRKLFVMVDVIDDDPDARWLSVCFYGDMISDPEEEGDLIPGGLLGEDGYCFDIDGPDQSLTDYVKERIDEACRSASGQA